jgi:hypothetical protein
VRLQKVSFLVTSVECKKQLKSSLLENSKNLLTSHMPDCRFWTHSKSMQVTGKLSKKAIALKEAEIIAALAIEGGPPGSPERLFQQSRLRVSSESTFRESPYIPKSKSS